MGLDEVFVAIGRVAGLGHSESRLQLGASAGAFDRIWSDDRQMGREARTLLHRAWGGGTLATDFRLHKLGADSKAGQHECWKDSCDAPSCILCIPQLLKQKRFLGKEVHTKLKARDKHGNSQGRTHVRPVRLVSRWATRTQRRSGQFRLSALWGRGLRSFSCAVDREERGREQEVVKAEVNTFPSS